MRKLFKIGADRHDSGKVVFSWHPEGTYIASAGRKGVIQITDRHGDIVDEIPMTTPAPILSLSWDKDGESLAILQDGNGIITLWNSSSKKVSTVDTNLKEPTFIAWSKTGSQLAIGTQKGNLLIYDKREKKKIPIVGKHGKKISCGAWSSQGNKLVLGSDDRSITVSSEAGDTLMQQESKSAPSQVLFTLRHNVLSTPQANASDNTVSAIINGKSIFVFNIIDEKDEPMELTFPESSSGSGCKYGELISHEWIEENSILAVFSGGYIINTSTSNKSLGEEKNQIRLHQGTLISCSYNSSLKRSASAGDDGVRIMDTKDFKEIKSDYISREVLEDGRITSVKWSPDGQILTIATNAGNVYNFLAKMNVLNSRHKSTIAYLSSLKEVSIVDAIRRTRPIDIGLKLEPSVIALGPRHVAAAMNAQVYFHRIGSSQVFEQSYNSTIKDMQLNESFAAALLDSRVVLHFIDPSEDEHNYGMKVFPSKDDGSYSRITCMALTDQFLYYGTEGGTVEVFYLSEKVMLSSAELRLSSTSIRQLFPNHNGTRVVIVDSTNELTLYNPVTGGHESTIRFEDAPTKVVSVIWDIKDSNVVMIYDGHALHTYVYAQSTMKGSILTKLGPMTVSADGQIELTPDKIETGSSNIPLVCCGGTLTCQTAIGNLTSILHPYYDHIVETNTSDGMKKSYDKKFLSNRFCQALGLLKLEVAWLAAVELDKRQFWLSLSGKAMELLNVELASRIYRQLGDAGMVMALKELQHIEDRSALAGHIAMLFCDYKRAQELFLESSRPIAAVEMRRNLLEWDQALKLAKALSSRDTAEIYVSYAQQLEFRDETIKAMDMYESAIKDSNNRQVTTIPMETIILNADMGLARCNIRNGKHAIGIQKAKKIDDRQLYIDCGDILEQEKQYAYAVEMFIRAQQYEKAGQIYVKYIIAQDKNDRNKITEAAVIFEKVKNDQLNAQFAKVCFASNRYEEAARAYERAHDVPKTIEIKLKHLDQVQQAFDMVRESSSAQGALVVSEYCQEKSDFRGVVEFLLIANKVEDAFNVAQSQGLMDVYIKYLGDAITNENALKVAVYYEKMQEFSKAAKYYTITGNYPRALKLYMKCGEKEIDAAIELVGKSRNDDLKNQLLDYLEDIYKGNSNSSYIYKLYMAWKKYDEAAKTAQILAREEQDAGKYPSAHAIIVETTQKLEEARRKVPLQLRQMFVLLHSYMLVRISVKRGDHETAARLLVRVAQNISKFKTNTVKILTSAVIECQRAGMKSTAYDFASKLMQPDHRKEMEKTDVVLKKKIEAIVRRRSAQNEEAAEGQSPCPISGQLIANSILECPTTRDALPMCIVTGRHILLNDCCMCPNSKFPAIYSEYVKYIRGEMDRLLNEAKQVADTGPDSDSPATTGKVAGNVVVECLDPILGQPVTIDDLKLLPPEEVTTYIQRYNNVIEETAADENLEDSNANSGGKPKKSSTSGRDRNAKSLRDARLVRREKSRRDNK